MLKIMSGNDGEQVSGPWVGYTGAHEHTGLSEAWLRELVMKGRIPFKKVGRRVLFSIPALDAWVSRGGAMDEDAA
jgi:excisionase family DNA binding protein